MMIIQNSALGRIVVLYLILTTAKLDLEDSQHVFDGQHASRSRDIVVYDT